MQYLITNKELVGGGPEYGDWPEGELWRTRVGFGLLKVRLVLGHASVASHSRQLLSYKSLRKFNIFLTATENNLSQLTKN